MTAGKGIVHAEMPFSHKGIIRTLIKEDTEVMQLWVNLPKKEKMCEPRYQYLNDTNVVKAEKDGVKVRIFAGKSLGIESPSFVKTPITYLMVEMQEN
jgi:redox-sensitive bicupin YhaK (pirin superfamily)